MPAIIPAPTTIPGKVAHRCFFPGHSDEHPSAVTFFHDGGHCYTYCSAEKRGEHGRYEIVGREARIFPASPHKFFRTLPLPPTSPSDNSLPERLFLHICRTTINRKEFFSLTSRGNVQDFWRAYLTAKGVDCIKAARLPNPPVISPVGIFFPTHVITQRGLIPDGGQLRSVGMKSISLFDMPGRHCFFPDPSPPRAKAILCVESPINAVRIACMGVYAISALGKSPPRELVELWNIPLVVIQDEPGSGDVVCDLDLLNEEQLHRWLLERGWKQ